MEQIAFAYSLKKKNQSQKKKVCNQLQMLNHFKSEIFYDIYPDK